MAVLCFGVCVVAHGRACAQWSRLVPVVYTRVVECLCRVESFYLTRSFERHAFPRRPYL